MKTKNHIAHALTYGTIVVGPVEGSWRLDTYQPKDGSRSCIDRTMVASARDVSTRHNNMTYGPGAGYDSACSCCWLGICHTVDKHAACPEAGTCPRCGYKARSS